MNGIIFCLFVIAIILFVGMIHYIGRIQKPGVYPPKRILKQRIMALGSGGVVIAFIAFLCFILTK